MTNPQTCRYQQVCPYNSTNCRDAEMKFCSIHQRFLQDEFARQQARKEEMRFVELYDIGLVEIVTRINRGEDIDRLREEARS